MPNKNKVMSDDTGKKSKGRKWLLIFLMIVAVIIAVTFLIFNFKYAEGNRAGVLIKFAKKGYIFKTYEGELNMGGVGTVANTALTNQIWKFSVKDQPTADSLMMMEGRKVSLHYTQINKNMPWQGETQNFVDGYKELPN